MATAPPHPLVSDRANRRAHYARWLGPLPGGLWYASGGVAWCGEQVYDYPALLVFDPRGKPTPAHELPLCPLCAAAVDRKGE